MPARGGGAPAARDFLMPFAITTEAAGQLTVMLAVIGGLLAGIAEIGKRLKLADDAGVRLIYRGSYLFTGLSLLVFVIRGLAS